jgi:hypothetical protein
MPELDEMNEIDPELNEPEVFEHDEQDEIEEYLLLNV